MLFFFNSFIYFNWRLSTLQYCSGFCHTLTWISQIDIFWAVVLEKSPLDSKETKPVNPKWNESWIFIGRTDAEAEAPIVWPPDAKSQLIKKDPDAGKGRRRRGRKRMRRWDGITDSMYMSLSKLLEIVKDRDAWRTIIHAVAKSRTRLSNWTATIAGLHDNCTFSFISNCQTFF